MTDVRVCGPNLNDQRRGSFHVHVDGCGDLRHYGPGRKHGGEVDGDREMLVTDATVRSVVYAVYDNGILDEAAADEGCSKDEVADSALYVDDFWFAPCVGRLVAS